MSRNGIGSRRSGPGAFAVGKALAAAIAATLCGTPVSAAQPPGPIDVVHHAVSITVDFQTREIEGHSEITLRARVAGQQRLTFSATHLQVDSVLFNGTALRRELGDGPFWAALKRYTRQHAGGVVNSRDLQRSLEQSSHRDLSRLFDEWVY